MVVSACRVVISAASSSPSSSFRPARSSSLFFTGRPSVAARCLSASMAAYSSLGMVKPSRTSLGLRVLTSLSAGAGAGAGAGAAAFLTAAVWAGTAFDGVLAAGVRGMMKAEL